MFICHCSHHHHHHHVDWMDLFVCCCFLSFFEQELNHVLRGALDRLRTDSPPAKMSQVNFRYVCVQVCFGVFTDVIVKLGTTAVMETRINTPVFVWQPDTDGIKQFSCGCVTVCVCAGADVGFEQELEGGSSTAFTLLIRHYEHSLFRLLWKLSAWQQIFMSDFIQRAALPSDIETITTESITWRHEQQCFWSRRRKIIDNNLYRSRTAHNYVWYWLISWFEPISVDPHWDAGVVLTVCGRSGPKKKQFSWLI